MDCCIDVGVSRSPVSAPALGAGGRGFESRYPDHREKPLKVIIVETFEAFFMLKNE